MLKTLKPLLFVALVAIFSLACKESNAKKEIVPVEQKSSAPAHEHPHTDEESTPAKPAAGVALNPAHGAPGHRCDIAVGQPLDSKPVPQNNANINPPHGQPGHRCDIAVGAPLTKN